jgi:DNA-binding beta-propeller fold protein YncE
MCLLVNPENTGHGMVYAKVGIAMKSNTLKQNIIATLCFLCTAALSMPAAAELQAVYQYPLSNFSGLVPSLLASLAIDQERNEIYVLNPHGSEIRIFNESGMEIYNFGEDGPLSNAIDIAVGADGDIFVLPRLSKQTALLRCNYRGELVSEIILKNVPAEFSSRIKPGKVVFSDGLLYLADLNAMRIMVVKTDGVFQRGYDLRAIITSKTKSSFVEQRLALTEDGMKKEALKQRQLTQMAEEEQKQLKDINDIDMSGFNVDGHGRMLFTVPSIFTVGRLSSDGELNMFGQPGSGPGKFGVVSGISADEQDNIYVADKLRCVVMIFDQNFQLMAEFGQRGYQPQDLIVPNDLVVDTDGKVYVSQAANRGVNVYKITSN